MSKKIFYWCHFGRKSSKNSFIRKLECEVIMYIGINSIMNKVMAKNEETAETNV